MARYSLWDEPWIPVLDTTGAPSRRSIRDTLVDARELREVFDPSPLVTVAIHRLLLAVLYRVFRPRTDREWADLWRAGPLDRDRLDSYGVVWSDRFDLLHATRPFYQVPRITDEKTHPISALVLEAASGNNPTLFDHGRVEGMDALPLDRAACHLLAHQSFAVGGGVSKPFNRMDGPLTKGLVVEARGRNLFETLLLNLMPLERWTSLVPDLGDDHPWWEWEEWPEPEQRGTTPHGPLHYLTWQSRQLFLECEESSGLVTGCQIRQRYCMPKDGRRVDPYKAYRESKEEGWLPFKLDKQRAVWQFTHALLQVRAKDVARPWLTEWLAVASDLRRRYGLDMPTVTGLSVSGLTTDPMKAAKIELWRREQLPIPMVLLEDPERVDDLAYWMSQAQRVESLLQRTALALAWALGERKQLPEALKYIRTGKVDRKIPDGYSQIARGLGMVTRYWPALEGPYRHILRDMDTKVPAALQENWQRAVRSAASQAFRAVRDNLLHAQAPSEVLTRVEQAFGARLARSFARNDEVEGGVNDNADPNE